MVKNEKLIGTTEQLTIQARYSINRYRCKRVRLYIYIYGTGSSVGIATELRAGRSGIESRLGRDFPPVQTGPGAHPASCTMGTGSFLGVKCGRGVLLTTHPHSSAAVMEEQSYTSTHPLGHTGPVTGSLYLLPYIYIYIYICTHTHTHTHIYIYIYIYTSQVQVSQYR